MSYLFLAGCRERAAPPPPPGAPAAETEPAGPVRPPAVAGGFYPDNPVLLGRELDRMLAAVPPTNLPGNVCALLVPHAGYVFSGQVAAHAFAQIKGRSYGTVVLLGSSHTASFPGAAVLARGRYATPLGEVPIDADLARRLLAAGPLLVDRSEPHGPDHCLEVEVPFLQRTLGKFKLVPILLGTPSPEVVAALALALAREAGPDTLVVASTDLSHYPRYEDAVTADAQTVRAVATGDPDALNRTLRQLESMNYPNVATLMCGEGAVNTLLRYLKAIGGAQPHVLATANSGDSSGDTSRVVGYAALAFTREGPWGGGATAEETLDPEDRRALLQLARFTVESQVRFGRLPDWSNRLPRLERPRGAFVTLKENGELRGCIGRFEPDEPLYRVVMQMAVAAATQDRRFPPVEMGELGGLAYEISVLSPLRRVKSWQDVEVGKHGVQIVRGGRGGVFLPQVATENGWDRDTFLSYLCRHKAGLPDDAWRDPETEIHVFTAQVFHE